MDALVAMPAKRRIVVAGEMLELGPQVRKMHTACGRHIAGRKSMSCSACVALRSTMVDAAKAAGKRAEFVATPEEAGEWLARETRDGDVVLLKASRGSEVGDRRWKSGRKLAARRMFELFR